ncbi:MAG TPA: hypothetical protein VMT81_02890 [Candidatus Paceibacterota bacterium]|nr:hypothetical protein [Candidatus Paceibacterota bacterium]
MGRKVSKKKHLKDEAGVISGLVFGVFGALICSLLFAAGEARTYGQLVAIAVGPTVGGTEWWKSKPFEVHRFVVIAMIVTTAFTITLHYAIRSIKQIQTWITSKLL